MTRWPFAAACVVAPSVASKSATRVCQTTAVGLDDHAVVGEHASEPRAGRRQRQIGELAADGGAIAGTGRGMHGLTGFGQGADRARSRAGPNPCEPERSPTERPHTRQTRAVGRRRRSPPLHESPRRSVDSPASRVVDGAFEPHGRPTSRESTRRRAIVVTREPVDAARVRAGVAVRPGSRARMCALIGARSSIGGRRRKRAQARAPARAACLPIADSCDGQRRSCPGVGRPAGLDVLRPQHRLTSSRRASVAAPGSPTGRSIAGARHRGRRRLTPSHALAWRPPDRSRRSMSDLPHRTIQPGQRRLTASWPPTDGRQQVRRVLFSPIGCGGWGA